jgi:hypothetical protein
MPTNPHTPAPSDKALAKTHDAELAADSPHGPFAQKHAQRGIIGNAPADSQFTPETGENGIEANFAAVNRDLKAKGEARLHSAPKVKSDRAKKDEPPASVPENRVVPQNAEQAKRAVSGVPEKGGVPNASEQDQKRNSAAASNEDAQNTPEAKAAADDSNVENVPATANPTVIQRVEADTEVQGPIGAVKASVKKRSK